MSSIECSVPAAAPEEQNLIAVPPIDHAPRSLDGGGRRGTVPLGNLARLERNPWVKAEADHRFHAHVVPDEDGELTQRVGPQFKRPVAIPGDMQVLRAHLV